MPQVGIISPANLGIVPSIEMVIWVAVGGRGTLFGAVIGALVVNAAKSGLSESFPDIWQYFLGALFVGVVVLFPAGIVGALAANPRSPGPARRALPPALCPGGQGTTEARLAAEARA